MMISDFFFLRPLWLLAFIPAGVCVVFAWRHFAHGNNNAWRALVDEHLLPELSVKAATTKHQGWQALALAISLAAVIIALAGPAWQKIDRPSYQSRTPTVVVLSLAQSMNSNDVTPSRIVRARHKLQDILDRSAGADTGLLIYADRPFVASPLTSDARVIQEMLPELSTDLMPVLGNRLHLALAEATNLLQQADARSGRIVVLADDLGIDSAAAVTAARNARAAGYEVDVLGVGTRSGATLVTASGRAITDASGQPMIAAYEENDLRQLAIAGGGHFVSLTADSTDIEQLFSATIATGGLEAGRKSGIEVDTWSDMGYWLLVIPVLLLPLVFRRNVIMVLPIGLAFGLATPTQQASASEWVDLFRTPDQQASAAFEAQDYETAAEHFENDAWKASAHFRNNDFSAAADAYATLQTDDATYNRGNALAKAGRLEEALGVYDQFLEKNPDDQDAQFNRDLVAKLLEQQQQDQDQDRISRINRINRIRIATLADKKTRAVAIVPTANNRNPVSPGRTINPKPSPLADRIHNTHRHSHRNLNSLKRPVIKQAPATLLVKQAANLLKQATNSATVNKRLVTK